MLRQGKLQPKAVIAQGDAPVAALSSIITGAILTFAHGRHERYVWTKPRPLGYAWRWVDGAAPLALSARVMMSPSSVRRYAQPHAGQVAQIGLLALLAEYLVIQWWRTTIMVAG